MSIKVGVRVRPFNKREQQLGCSLCVKMEGKDTFVGPHRFSFDYSLWSHDGFTNDENGYSVATGNKYADQNKVYEYFGVQMLRNAWEGYNCCIFAYGQTGAGKSYSIFGYGANTGIVPRLCEQLFKSIERHPPGSKFEVQASMMEIYNERIKDLATLDKRELKVSEHPKLGPYVNGLEKVLVRSYQEISNFVDKCSKNRSVAATLMNASSSRSHTIAVINFVQTHTKDLQASVKYSVINIVDLAGSENVEKTGNTDKDRLQQTAKINQSLTTLSRVISELSSGKKGAFIPYRDSKLTYILKNALGGNSKTAMMCAISPASDNEVEILSTLRYAERVKKIMNNAVVNQTETDKLIRMLRQQNTQLKSLLAQYQGGDTSMNKQLLDIPQNPADSSMLQPQEDLLGDFGWNPQIQSPKNRQAVDQFPSVNQLHPYITNISEDCLLSYRVKYNCIDLTIGNKMGQPRPDIVLAGLGIQPRHVRFIGSVSSEPKEGKAPFCSVEIEVLCEQATEYAYLNGESLQQHGQRTTLYHHDRLVFGTGCAFLLVLPGSPEVRPGSKSLPSPPELDYETVMMEIQQIALDNSTTSNTSFEEDELRKKILDEIEEQKDQKSLKRQASEAEQEKREAQLAAKLREMEEQKNRQLQQLKEELTRKQEEAATLAKEKQLIQTEIQKQNQLKNAESLEELTQTQRALNEKIERIALLEEEMQRKRQESSEQEQRMKLESEEFEKKLQLEIGKHSYREQNEFIMEEYITQTEKRIKNYKQLLDAYLSKEKRELLRKLMPQVTKSQKFNLMGREMKKPSEVQLVLKYDFVSEGELLEALKSKTFAGRVDLGVQLTNREEHRFNEWSLRVFENRYLLAEQAFETYVRNQYGEYIVDREAEDPYWDPETQTEIGICFLSLEPLLYCQRNKCELNIVRRGQSQGIVKAEAFLVDPMFKTETYSDEYRLSGPRQRLFKPFSFQINLQLKSLTSELEEYKAVRLSYHLKEADFRTTSFSSQPFAWPSDEQIGYSNIHCLSEVSQNLLTYLIQSPLRIHVHGICRITQSTQSVEIISPSPGDSRECSPRASFMSADGTLSIEMKRDSVQGVILENKEAMDKLQQGRPRGKVISFDKDLQARHQVTFQTREKPRSVNWDTNRTQSSKEIFFNPGGNYTTKGQTTSAASPNQHVKGKQQGKQCELM